MKSLPLAAPLALALALGPGALPPAGVPAPAGLLPGCVTIPAGLLPHASVAFAAQTVAADGVYTIGGLDESLKSAKIRARLEALRLAAEQAGVYIAASTEASGGALTSDDIQTLASAVLSVTTETYTTDDLGGEGLEVTCHIEATLSESKLDDLLRARREAAERWERTQELNRSLREQIAKLQQENAALEAEYAQAQTAAEKERIQSVAARNQEAVAAADWVQRASSAYHAGQYQQAIASYTEAIRLDPSDAAAYAGRGNAYFQTKQYAQAVQDYTEVIRRDPTSSKAYTNRGNSYNYMGNYKQGLRDCTEAIRLDPTQATAYYDRGISYKNLGKPQQAIEDYTEAIRLRPNYADAYINRGNLSSEAGREQEAMADYTAALRIRPDDAVAHYNRALIYAQWEQYEQAIEDSTEAIRLGMGKNAYRAYRFRARAYFSLGAYAAAYQDAMQANQLKPGYADNLLKELRQHGY